MLDRCDDAMRFLDGNQFTKVQSWTTWDGVSQIWTVWCKGLDGKVVQGLDGMVQIIDRVVHGLDGVVQFVHGVVQSVNGVLQS